MSGRLFFALWPEGVLRMRLDRALPGMLDGVAGRLQRPNQWHVTLARKVMAPPVSPLREPVRWPVERFALVRSVTGSEGSRYEPLRWWNLAGRAG